MADMALISGDSRIRLKQDISAIFTIAVDFSTVRLFDCYISRIRSFSLNGSVLFPSKSEVEFLNVKIPREFQKLPGMAS